MNSKRLKTARIVMTVLTAAAIAFIFGNSLLSAEKSSKESGFLLTLLNRLLCALQIDGEISSFVIRKLAHFTEYAVLGALLSVTMFLYLRKRKWMMLTAVPIGALVAVCDELIQMTSPGRSCEVRDMLIDGGGVVFASLIVLAVISIKGKRKKIC